MVSCTRRRVVAAALALALAAPSVLRAQREASLDAGYVSIAYDSAARVSGFTIAPELHLTGAATELGASGALSVFNAGGWSGQGTLAGSAFTPSFHRLRVELAGVASGSGFENGIYAGEMLGQARLHVLGAQQGAWLALGGGQSWNSIESRSTALAGVGGWMRRGGALLTASVSPTSVAGLHFTDATASLTWTGASFELSGTLTTRRGDDVVPNGAWGNASATLWLSRRMALVAGGGRYASDPVQSLPGGRYFTLSLRLGTRPVAYPTVHVRRPARVPARPGAARAVDVRDGSDGQRIVRIQVADAERVELMGDFTDWRPVSLVNTFRDDWEIALPIAPGTHYINVRIDGGDWSVPATIPSMADDFNGRVGVLIVQ
ncbi:MAG TPA: glycogen-binding domain-containing protein [Gemmatimonadaceae bacterium]